MTKKAFILSLPDSLSAKEVVAKGAEEKIKLSENQVHAVRSQARSAVKTAAKKAMTKMKRRGPGRPKTLKKRVASVSVPLPIINHPTLAKAKDEASFFGTSQAARDLVIVLDGFIRARVRQALLSSLRSELAREDD